MDRMLKAVITGVFFLFYWSDSNASDTMQYPRLEYRGYIKSLQGVFVDKNAANISSINIIHNRINIPVWLSDKLTARLEFRNRLFYGDQVKLIPQFSSIIDQYNGIWPLSLVWLDKNGLIGHTLIDRLWISYRKGPWEITAGRQRLNWGLTNIWPLNDVFNTYNFLDFDYEERPGNDALSIAYRFSGDKALVLVTRPGIKNSRHITSALYQFNIRGYDIQTILGYWEKNFLTAGGWAGSIGNTGFKGEYSYFRPVDSGQDTSDAFNATISLDRTFSGNWYIITSVLYQSRPMQTDITGGSIAGRGVTAKHIFPFDWSFHVGISKQIADLNTVGIQLIYAPENHTTVIIPSVSRDLGSNLDVDLIGQFFVAEFQHKYADQFTVLYLRGRWSF